MGATGTMATFAVEARGAAPLTLLFKIAGAGGVAATLPVGNICACGLGLAAGTARVLTGAFPGPPGLRSFPCVTGLTTPGFLRAGGRDTLLGGSPEPTRTS